MSLSLITFDNSLYSLRFDTTTSADVIINAITSDYVAPKGLEESISPVAKGQNYNYSGTDGSITDEESNARRTEGRGRQFNSGGY